MTDTYKHIKIPNTHFYPKYLRDRTTARWEKEGVKLSENKKKRFNIIDSIYHYWFDETYEIQENGYYGNTMSRYEKMTGYEYPEDEESECASCGTTCLDHTSNKGRGSESPCSSCEELRCKHCPCECDN